MSKIFYHKEIMSWVNFFCKFHRIKIKKLVFLKQIVLISFFMLLPYQSETNLSHYYILILDKICIHFLEFGFIKPQIATIKFSLTNMTDLQKRYKIYNNECKWKSMILFWYPLQLTCPKQLSSVYRFCLVYMVVIQSHL